MPTLCSAMLVIVGVIHLLPLSGLIGPAQLTKLYGIAFDEPNLAILMRHRAILFGLLGAFLVYAAVRPDLQRLAILAGFISAGSFVWLAWSVGGYNGLIGRVVVADVIALVCCGVALAAHLAGTRAG